MKIILTNSFLKKYKKIISIIDLDKLSNKIQKNSLISLNYPYSKLKLYIGGLAFRGILLKTKGGNIVFLVLCFKKDKSCGDNLSFDTYKKEIIDMETKVYDDIQKGEYIVL